jgi:hypothetical protein
MSSTIKGELFVNYNGEMSKTHLKTDANLVEGFEDKVAQILDGNVVRNTSTNLKRSNSLYDSGMLIFETDTQQMKITDGEHTYNELPYIKGEFPYEIQKMGSDGKYH